MKLDLPYPPSANKYWRRVGNKTLLSKAARQYKQAVYALCLGAGVRPGRGRLAVEVLVSPPDRRKRDLDNLLKAVLDSLNGLAWDDDSQIDELRLARRPGVLPGGGVTVTWGEVRRGRA